MTGGRPAQSQLAHVPTNLFPEELSPMITLAPPPAAERTDELAAGVRLGDCTIAETLHRGADATVYSAWVSGRDRIALKVLDREAARNPRRLRSFYVTAKLAMLLNHPRLAPVLSVGEAAGRHHLVMPLFEQQIGRAHV